MLLQDLAKRELIHPPKWLPDNCVYLTIMGSVAYSVSSDTSDMDVYGCAIPPKTDVFRHLAGYIDGFDPDNRGYDDPWQQHHIKVPDWGKEYDFAVYGIVRYFKLVMDNNPNCIDSLFTPDNCVLHSTSVGTMIRENRKLFLHKGAWHRFKGYAYQQLHKMSTKDPEAGSKRAKLREQFGYDVKFAYHVVRLMDEAEQILTLGDLDLGRAREHMKAVRKGEVSEADLRKWAADKELALEKMYAESKLQHSPDTAKIKALLLQCLEHHYGSLDKCLVMPDAADLAIREIASVVERYRKMQRSNESVTKPQ